MSLSNLTYSMLVINSSLTKGRSEWDKKEQYGYILEKMIFRRTMARRCQWLYWYAVIFNAFSDPNMS